MLKTDMQEIVNTYKSNLSIDYLEDALGYNPGALQNKTIYIYDVPSPSLKMPSGNEGGANNLWLPGGKTSGGRSEAVLNNQSIQHNNSINNLPSAKPILSY